MMVMFLDVINEVISQLGMKAIEDTHWVPDNVQQHAVNLSGIFCRSLEDAFGDSSGPNMISIYARVIAKLVEKTPVKRTVILKVFVLIFTIGEV